MDRQQIKKELETLFAVVNEEFTVGSDISEDVHIRDGLGLDSLQIAELLFEIEEKFDAKISDEEARGIRTVRDLIDVIQTKQDEGA